MRLDTIRGILGALLAPRRRPTQPDTRGAIVYEDPGTRRLRALHSDGTDSALTGSGGGGGGAPTNASYVVISNDGTLTAERVLRGTAGRLTVTDGGAGTTVTLDVGTDVYRSGGTDVAVVDGGTGASSASQARINLGLAIGTNVQAYDADLDALAGVSTTGLLVRTGAGTAAARTITGDGWISVTNGDGVAGAPALALAPQTQTVSAGTDTVSAGKGLVLVTHASPTITLPALMTTGAPLVLRGPNTSGAYAVIVRAGSDTIETGATGIRIDGYGWEVLLYSDGTSWRVRVLRGVCQLPVAVIDTTGVSGSSPWTTPTNAVGGASVTFTDRSTASSTTSASSGILLTPAASTGFWSGSPTGAGVSCEVSALGIDPTKDSFAVLARVPITGTYGSSEGVSVVLGITVSNTGKIGTQLDNLTSRARWGTAGNAALGTVTTGDAVGFTWDAQSERVRALGGAWSGTAQSDLWPLNYAAPGGQMKAVYDPGGGGTTSTDIATLTRILIGASVLTAGETWTLKYLIVVKLITGGQ